MSKDEFRKLQREWYDKLAESGFQDIEILKDGELVLKDENTFHFITRFKCSPQVIKAKQDYYLSLHQIVQNEETTYRDEIDKYILFRHAEGAKIQTIVEELLKMGKPKCRRSIRVIIRRYVMSWGLRDFTPNQLNIYK